LSETLLQSKLEVEVLVLVLVDVVVVLAIVDRSQAPQRMGHVLLMTARNSKSVWLQASFWKLPSLHNADVSSVNEQFRSFLTLNGFKPGVSC